MNIDWHAVSVTALTGVEEKTLKKLIKGNFTTIGDVFDCIFSDSDYGVLVEQGMKFLGFDVHGDSWRHDPKRLRDKKLIEHINDHATT